MDIEKLGPFFYTTASILFESILSKFKPIPHFKAKYNKKLQYIKTKHLLN